MCADSTLRVGAPTRSHTQRGVATFAQDRAAFESFLAGVTIFWRPLPSAVEMQRHLAHVAGTQPWELRTNAE
jgi:hypothetical protein